MPANPLHKLFLSFVWAIGLMSCLGMIFVTIVMVSGDDPNINIRSVWHEGSLLRVGQVLYFFLVAGLTYYLAMRDPGSTWYMLVPVLPGTLFVSIPTPANLLIPISMLYLWGIIYWVMTVRERPIPGQG